MARRKDMDARRKVLLLYKSGTHSPREIAELLGLPAGRIRTLMWRMRKEGLLPKVEPIGDLLDDAVDRIKAALLRVSAAHAEIVARDDRKLAGPLAEAQELLDQALRDVAIYRKMKQLEGGRA